MRIAIVAPEFPPEVGGMQTYAAEFAKELAARRHEVVVFTRPHSTGEMEIPDVDVRPDLRLSRRRDRMLLKGTQFDVWHVMNAAYAWLALETSNVVVSVHGNDFLRPYLPVAMLGLAQSPRLWRISPLVERLDLRLAMWRTRQLVTRALPRASVLLTNSKYTEAVLLERYPNCRGLTHAAMVGVGRAFLTTPLSERAVHQTPRLITVCRLAERRKNVDRVLRALAALQGTYAFHYTVVGDGQLRTELESLSRELGLDERVTFTGAVSEAILRKLLAESDLFVLASGVLPYSHEGFGIAYLEASACGTPVLAARQAGAAEAVEEGVNGYFVDEPSVPNLVNGLMRFLDGEVRFERAACRDFARQFSWTRVVDDAVRLYPGRH